ncbi:hypothetical protein, partial [Xanthomonas vasicola]|uniref:hypothetical protein n=1 Tax=Xanthomonas vasicola TaxID=56459 RepID=UPI001F491CFF
MNLQTVVDDTVTAAQQLRLGRARASWFKGEKKRARGRGMEVRLVWMGVLQGTAQGSLAQSLRNASGTASSQPTRAMAECHPPSAIRHPPSANPDSRFPIPDS